ncbi:MAG: hypothetical protein V4850_32640 [Myxococcota bacterium]
MLMLLASLSLAAETTAPPIVTDGPGRPVVGIGAGLRGATSAAGFVTSVRVRVTPWFVVDPMAYVLLSTTELTTTTRISEDPEYWAEQTETEGETTTYGALALRFRVAQGKRASAWVLASGSLLSGDVASVASSTSSTTPEGEEAPEVSQRYQSIGGNVGVGFAGEVWLRPELTLSADAGFNVWEASKTVFEVGLDDTVGTTSGFKLSPFVQLALHLYL